MMRQSSNQSENTPYRDDCCSVQIAVRIRPLSAKEGENSTSIHALLGQSDSIADVASLDLDGTNHSFSSLGTFSTIGTACQSVQVGEQEENHSFTYDHVFPPSTSQVHFYSTCVTPLINSCLQGYNATILAYGQTGSGKTHTIIGDVEGEGDQEELNVGVELDDDIGVIPRALHDIFLELENSKMECDQEKEDDHEVREINQQHSIAPSSSKPQFEYQVKVQFLELYGELIQDLITTESNEESGRNDARDQKSHRRRSGDLKSLHASRRKSHVIAKKVRLILHDGNKGEDAEVVGISQAKVKSAGEALQYLRQGMDKRHTEKTAMNSASSRSHAIFTLVIQQSRRGYGGVNAHKNEVKTSKIHFVDLAGSERIKSAHTKGLRLQEGISINRGLLALGNVISALGDPKKRCKEHTHVPYRDSKLTRLLKGSLGGNHETLMIACVSPSKLNKDESMNTLRYANRAKNITNHATVNVDPISRSFNELQKQVVDLATELHRVLSTCKFDDTNFKSLFAMDQLKNLMHGTDASIKRRPETPRPSSASNPITNKVEGGLRMRSLSSLSLGIHGEQDLMRSLSTPSLGIHGEQDLYEIKEEHNAETLLYKNDEDYTPDKNKSVEENDDKGLDNSLHSNDMILDKLIDVMKTHITIAQEAKMQLQSISIKIRTLVREEEDSKSILELFGDDSKNLSEVTKFFTVKKEEIASLREEKDRISKRCIVADEKTKKVGDLIKKRQSFEVNRTSEITSDLKVKKNFLPLNDSIDTYAVFFDTQKEYDNNMLEVRRRKESFVSQLSLTEGIVVSEEKSELVYSNDVVAGLVSASKSTRNLHNCESSSEERTELHCHDRDSSSLLLSQFVSNKPTPIRDFTPVDGKAYECVGELKQHVQDDYATERSVLDSYNSSNGLFTSSNIPLACQVSTQRHFYKPSPPYNYSRCSSRTQSYANHKIASNKTSKYRAGNTRMKYCIRNRTLNSDETQPTVPSITIFSSSQSNTHLPSFSKSVLGNERVDFINVQKYDSDCCGFSFLDQFTHGKNSVLTSSDEIPPDVLGKFIYTDSEPINDEENMEVQYDEGECCFSLYFSNLMMKFFVQRVQPVTWQCDEC